MQLYYVEVYVAGLIGQGRNSYPKLDMRFPELWLPPKEGKSKKSKGKRKNTYFCLEDVKVAIASTLPIFALYASILQVAPVKAQTIDPTQIPNLDPPTPPQLPEPQELPQPEELLKPTTPNPEPPAKQPTGPRRVPTKIKVERFVVEGSTVFSQEEFDEILSKFTIEPISFAELLEARSAVTKLYEEKGYITTGALIPAEQTIQDGVVKILVVEGKLEAIKVTGTKYLNPNYIRSRVAIAAQAPVNQDRLLQALQLIQLDPRIQTVSAELSAGSRPGQNILEVTVTEEDPFSSKIILDNGRSPSVSTFRRGASVNHVNLFGFADELSVAYSNTEGSNAWDVTYSLPLNAHNGRVSASYSTSRSEIIEPPFDRVDIEAKSRNYELTLRQPLLETPTREIALGLTAQRRESDTSLLGVRFPLSPGANEDGETRVSALRFFQEFRLSSASAVFVARSQFSLGVGLFDATVNRTEPDSRFVGWRGQVQMLRLLAPETVLLLRSDVQISPMTLLPMEQFGMGGFESVRGYREDALLTDNGAFASAELRIPIYRTREREVVVQLAPFVDVGTVWNSDGRNAPEINTLLSVGLGLQVKLGSSLRARFDWGYPLIDVKNSRDRTWQENGFYFTVESTPF